MEHMEIKDLHVAIVLSPVCGPMRYTKLEVPWTQKAKILTKFSARLRDSGYPERYRQQLI